MGEPLGVMGAFGARADEAHLPAEDIPELGEFVEVPAADEGADAKEAGIVAGGALLRGVGRGGIGGHAAEFVEGKGTVVGTDAGLAEKNGAAGRLAFDEGGKDEDERCGGEEAEDRAHEVEGALEGAGEEAIDREFLDAEDRDAADGLEAETAEKNIEGAGNDLPFDVGAFADLDDVLQVGAGKIEAGNYKDVGRGALKGVGEFGERAEDGRGVRRS